MKKIITTFALLLILSFPLITLLTSLVSATEDSWTTMSPMPTERFSFGVAVVNDKIFAIGGALASESDLLADGSI